jgi:hypothetical protein
MSLFFYFVFIFHQSHHSLGTSVLKYDSVFVLLVHASADLQSMNYGLFCSSYDAFQLFRLCSVEWEMMASDELDWV